MIPLQVKISVCLLAGIGYLELLRVEENMQTYVGADRGVGW